MFKKLVRFTVIGATVLLLAACANNQGAGDMQGNGFRTNYRDGIQPLGADRYGVHNNRNLTLNRDVARAIEQIDGISRANVVTGETNAYVAVELDRQGGAQRRRGTMGGNYADVGNRGANLRAANRDGGNGLVGGLTTGGTARGNGTMGSTLFSDGAGFNVGLLDMNGTLGYGQYRGLRTDQNLGVYRGRSGRIGLNNTGMMGDGTTGMYGTTDNMASRYMYNGGAFGRRGGDTIGPLDTTIGGGRDYFTGRAGGADANRIANGVTPMIRSQIERTVRSMVPGVNHVFVSADPAFMRQLSNYSARLGGDNLNNRGAARGLVRGFNRLVQGIFVEPFDNDNYDLNDRFNVRNRNGVTDTLNNGFTRTNPRNMGGLDLNGWTDNAVDTNRTPAGTINTLR